MTTRPRILALGLALAAVAGCDTMPSTADAGPSGMVAAGASGSLVGVPALPPVPPAGADSLDLIVFFVPGTDPEKGSDDTFTEQDVRRRGYVAESASGVAITVSVRDIDALWAILQTSPIVASVELDIQIDAPEIRGAYVPLSHDYTGFPSDAVVAQTTAPGSIVGQMTPWSVSMVQGESASSKPGDGAGTTDIDVYVIDSGVDHPEVNVVEAVRFFPASAGDGSTMHGNHVAATIAAVDDGVGMVGVAPGARVHSLDVFDASGRGSLSQLVRAVDHVTAAKRADPSRPMVVNMSVGARTGTALNALDRAIQASIAEGVVYVVAAGNQSVSASEISPAHVPEAITVGAFGADRRFAADFSNHGAVVDILAPGVRVVSAADDGRYAALDGTSMAAPHVAGAAALILARRPTASPASVEQLIRHRSRDLVQLAPPGTTTYSLWLASF